MGRWNNAILEHWDVDAMTYWNIRMFIHNGTRKQCDAGTMIYFNKEGWNNGIVEQLDFDTMTNWNIRTLKQ